MATRSASLRYRTHLCLQLEVAQMIDADKWPASSPMWRVSWQYVPQPSDTDSYDSHATASEAIDAAKAMIGEPERFDKVRISWPHYLHEKPEGEGWIAVADLTPEQKRSLDLLLMPHEKPQ